MLVNLTLAYPSPVTTCTCEATTNNMCELRFWWVVRFLWKKSQFEKTAPILGTWESRSVSLRFNPLVRNHSGFSDKLWLMIFRKFTNWKLCLTKSWFHILHLFTGKIWENVDLKLAVYQAPSSFEMDSFSAPKLDFSTTFLRWKRHTKCTASGPENTIQFRAFLAPAADM